MDAGQGHQFRRRRFVRRRRAQGELASVHREDPLAGVANLFDASIVFAVGLMVALLLKDSGRGGRVRRQD